MPLNFAMSSNLAVSSGVKVLAYGSAGAGKTMLCATAPRPFLITSENGLLSLAPKNIAAKFGTGRQDITYDIPSAVITCEQDLYDVYGWLLNSPDAQQFYTLCGDSLSDIAEVILKNSRGIHTNKMQQYGRVGEMLLDFCQQIQKGWPRHAYLTCKEEFVKDEASGGMRWVPMLVGQMAPKHVPFIFDEVVRVEATADLVAKDIKRVIHTTSGQNFICKDRSGCLDPEEPMHLGNIFNKIMAAA